MQGNVARLFLPTLLCCALPAVAASKPPLSLETLLAFPRVGPPAVSPDGKWIAYTVDDDLFLTPPQPNASRRLTSSKGSKTGLAWSPDSKRLAFSWRGEIDTTAQIYLLDPADPKSVRLTTLPTSAATPRFSPDGKSILFESMVPTAAAKPSSALVFDGFPVRHWNHWIDDRRPHLFLQEAQPSAKARDLSEKWAGYHGVLTNAGEELQPAWAPDGQIIFTATEKLAESAWSAVSTSLYATDIDARAPRALIEGATPRFAAGGATLYFTDTRGARAYNLTTLKSIAWPRTAEPTTITAGWDRSVTDFDPLPSGSVLITAEDTGQDRLFLASPGVKHFSQALDGSFSAPSAAANTIAALWSSATQPPELVSIDPNTGRHQLLTNLHDAAQTIAWLPPRHFTFTNRQGAKVHNMMALPPSFDSGRKYPVLVWIHGGPHGSFRDVHTQSVTSYQLLASKGYVVLLTNYTGSTGFGEKFAQAIEGKWATAPAADLNEAIDLALRRYPFLDKDRIAVGGLSYGGFLTNWLMANSTRFRCAISWSGPFNIESQSLTRDYGMYRWESGLDGPPWIPNRKWNDQNPYRLSNNFKIPVLVVGGERDYRVPINETMELWNVLQRRRVPGRLLIFPDEGHGITKPENQKFLFKEITDWLAKHLG